MEARSLQAAPAEHLEDLGHLIANLRADPRTARLVPGVEMARATLAARSEDWRQKYNLVHETQSGMEHAEEDLHLVVRTCRDVILADVRHSRRAPKFQIYFPRGLRAVIRAPYTDQLVSVRAIAERCAQDPSPKIREQAGTLHAAADRMQAAFNRRAQALAAESASSGQVQEQKIQTVETCRRISNRLSELYPNQWNRVRSYFRRPRRGARQPEDAAAGTAPALVPAAETAPALVPAAETAPALVPAAETTGSPVLVSRQGQGNHGEEVAKLVGLAP